MTNLEKFSTCKSVYSYAYYVVGNSHDVVGDSYDAMGNSYDVVGNSCEDCGDRNTSWGHGAEGITPLTDAAVNNPPSKDDSEPLPMRKTVQLFQREHRGSV